MDLSPEEERIYRAYRLGLADQRQETPRGLDAILGAIRTEASLQFVIESREAMLERMLSEERSALRALREKYGESAQAR